MEVTDLKNKYKKIKYKNTNVYEYVKNKFNRRLQNSKAVENIIFSDVFNKSDNKAFTLFESNLSECLGNIYSNDGKTNALEEYRNLVADTILQCENVMNETNVTATDIMCVCGIHYTLDKYIGFMMEYMLKAVLISRGFTVMSSRDLDGIYKIDLVVGHPNSNKAIAIQCKSSSYLNKCKSLREKHIKSMSNFKNKGYRNYKALENVQDIDIKYMLHLNDNFGTFRGNALIDTNDITNYMNLDMYEYWWYPYNLQYSYKSLELIIEEISYSLGMDTNVEKIV